MKPHYRKAVLITGLVLLSSLLLLASAQQASYAQAPEATPVPILSPTATSSPSSLLQGTVVPPDQSLSGAVEVTFAQLNQPTFELRSPLDQQQFRVEIPRHWSVTGDESYIELHYDNLQQSPSSTSQAGEVTNEKGMVTVYLNDVVVTTFAPVEGRNRVLRLPIPSEAVSKPDQTVYQVRVFYLSQDCTKLQSPSLFVVYDHSFIHFAYNLLPLKINLADFPQPLVQGLFTTETLTIIIPDQYSDADLAAAASVAATLGQRSYGTLNLELITAAEATAERLADTSAIIVGQPRNHAFLLDLYRRNRLPTTLTYSDTLIVTRFDQPVLPDDGVLQEIPSEFSNNAVFLIVTGTSDLAVTRAAQALSVLAPRYGFDGNLVVISDFQEIMSKAAKPSDTISLADLGFADTVFYGIGSHRASTHLLIPPNWHLTGDPTLTLSYFHSGALLPSSSSLTVDLNGGPVGNAPLDNSVLGEQQAVFQLPNTDLKAGRQNSFDFLAAVNVNLKDCVLPDLNSAWIRINGASQLQLPHTVAEEEDIVPSLDEPLGAFVSRQDLSDVWFSLPSYPTRAELAGMVHVASWLGNLSRGVGFAPQVSRGAIDDMTQLKPYHVIAFGLPTNNPVIASINEQLPQPFVPGEDNLRQQIGNIDYRLPDGFSLGLLQTLPAPWNPKRAVLVATGTTQEGVEQTIKALTDDELYYEFGGNVAFLTEDRIESVDSTKFIRGALLAEVPVITKEGESPALEAITPTVSTSSTTSTTTGTLVASNLSTPSAPGTIPTQYLPPNESTPDTINMVIFGLIGVGLLVAVVGGILSWRRSKTRQ